MRGQLTGNITVAKGGLMKLNIHGDNIVECERTLGLIARAYAAKVVRMSDNIYCPQFRLIVNGNPQFEVTLYSGHGRWGVDIQDILSGKGAPIREATDAYITKEENGREEIILAIEYCNALPAGNNAWQRNGRAVTCAELGIPYFYYAEVGGVELDSRRNVKAPRFPNPIVPFSYLSASLSLDVICIPIYEAHLAITDALLGKFQTVFGLESSLLLLKGIVEGSNHSDSFGSLKEKGLSLVKILASERKRIDTLKGEQWDRFLQSASAKEKTEWLSSEKVVQPWKRKQSGKIKMTKAFKKLAKQIKTIDCISIGASEIPICLIPKHALPKMIEIFENIYAGKGIDGFISNLKTLSEPLVVVWITGFKPGGDDSRPDRGLVPLARMIFGNDIQILSIVYGPAFDKTWKIFKEDPLKLPQINGLWEAIMNLSNLIFADSATSKFGPLYHVAQRTVEKITTKVLFPAAKKIPIGFAEHDVDSAIYLLFSRMLGSGIYISMCNPPGGDWSGISVLDFLKEDEYRWTSLPRVSAVRGKRPDHVIQLHIDKRDVFLSIESKNNPSDLENQVGKRLCRYLDVLFHSQPIAYKAKGDRWKLHTSKKPPLKTYEVISAGAFCFRNSTELSDSIARTNCDIAMGFEFKSENEVSILHLKTSQKCEFFRDVMAKIVGQFNSGIKIQVH